jgi:hypothetical protein
MRSILPAFVLAAALGACSGAQHDDTAAKAGQSGAPLGQALPQGFALHFPFDFQEDVVVSVNARDQRRRVTVEYLEGDSKMIMASLARSALEAGFQSGRWQLLKDGSIYFFAYKGGYGQMRAEIKSGGNLRNASAKGTVVTGWPVRRATAPTSPTSPSTPADTKAP